MRQPLIGLNQWFHYEDHDAVETTIALMQELGARHLRTGISWADFLRPGGRRWYDWQMAALRDAGIDVLLSLWHVPPSLSEGGSCASPPRNLKAFADFVDLVITDYGDCFADLELWNEPNNRLKWDFPNFDPTWAKFGEMIGMAAYWAKQRGRRTVLGGMVPVDHHWLSLIKGYGVLPYIDAIAIHGFPGMWWDDAPNWEWYRDWKGWDAKIDSIRPHCEGKPVWVTETGLATCDVKTGKPMRHDLQVSALEAAATAPCERVYWYSVVDLDPQRAAIEGFHVDENEYHLGLVTFDGHKKPAFYRMQELLAEQNLGAAARGRVA